MTYLSDIIHQSGPDPMHPQWDTMIAIRNLSTVPTTARIRIYGEDTGLPVPWPGYGDHRDLVIKPGVMLAASFLPGNGFGDHSPQDFKGHATIEPLTPFGFNPFLFFALGAFNAWKYGVDFPLQDQQSRPGLAAQAFWRSAYAIPHFDDRGGATAALWGTGISVQNFGSTPVTMTARYTVGQAYSGEGSFYSFDFTVPASGGVRFDLLTGNAQQQVPGLLSSGYPADFNSEGHLDLSVASPALLFPSMIIASSDYSFMAKQAFQ